ncbi:MAG: hypothetical protein ACPG5B_06340 [Chitinophagales bacterium]
MKDKIVFWGTNENDADILVLLRLRAEDNKVDLWTFPKEELDQEFVLEMFKDWDNIDIENLPTASSHIEQNMSEPSLLPDHIKTTETELVNRAEKEWYVRVLSIKLSQKIEEEVEQLYQQVQNMLEYDKDIWNLTKSFWDKINMHYQDHDLTKEHASKLRDKINSTFDKLKRLRKTSNEKFETEAKANFEALQQHIQDLIDSLAKPGNLNGLFERLKNLQNDSNTLKLTRNMRNALRERFNEAFAAIRQERKNSYSRKLEGRMNGLKNAIAKMQQSLDRDHGSLKFQHSRIQSTQGQLEAKLRQAKIQMIEARISSKEEKLEDMFLTMETLTKQVEQERAKEKAEREKAEAKRKADKAKREAKAAADKAKREARAKATAERKAAAKAKKEAELKAKAAEEEKAKQEEKAKAAEEEKAKIEAAQAEVANLETPVEEAEIAVVEVETEAVASEVVEVETEAIASEVVEIETEVVAEIAVAEVETVASEVAEIATEKVEAEPTIETEEKA